MRVTEVQLATDVSELFTFSLDLPDVGDRHYIRAMVGMDADSVVSRFSQFGRNSGKPLFTQSLPAREVVLRIVLNPDWANGEDYSTLRDDIYRGISANRRGTVYIKLIGEGVILAQVEGVVTKLEVPHMSKVPELQITIRSEQGLLQSPNAFLYPTTQLNIGDNTIVDSVSTAPHGHRMTFNLSGSGTYFNVISNTPSDPTAEWRFDLTPDVGLQNNDVLVIDSLQETRDVYITRIGVDHNLLNDLTLTSVWPMLYPGRNDFTIETDATYTWGELTYYYTYWGI